MAEITIRKPDDWHVHFRDGAMMKAVVPFTARQFGRAIVMPNLVPPITTGDQARAYRERILSCAPAGFTPLMTCYLTDSTDPDEIAHGFAEGVFTAAKLYPAHATTNSASGVTDIEKIIPVLEKMDEIGMRLCVHGEVTSKDVDIFDREAVFIENVLVRILERAPGLRVIMEHITTQEAVDFVLSQEGRVGATITAHHLMINRNAIFEGGIRPHMYCLPIAKREKHRLAVRKAASSGLAPFFLGTDTAPHARDKKEAACGCAGIFTAPCAMECYAQVFEEENALDKLEAFASINGPVFYGLPINQDTITLTSDSLSIPDQIQVGDGSTAVPFKAGETLRWRMV